MLYTIKHNKFLQNGFIVLKALQNKAYYFNEKYKISHKKNVIKEDIFAFSKNVYEDISPVLKGIQKQYERTSLPNLIDYSLNTIKEINRDIHINPLSKETEEQVRNINTKYFLAVGVACFLLSSVTFNYETDINKSHFLNINFNLSHPKENPANQLAQSLQPKFMVSVFHTKLEAFTKLLGITEGKANFFYKDNLGVATAYGWNPTKNSKEFNVDLAHKIGMSSYQVKYIEKISDNNKVQSVPAALKKVVLSDKQVQKSAEFMMTFYENEFLKVMKIKAKEDGKNYTKVLKAYRELPNNQQAVMVHMTYKVGTKNLLKYDQFFKELFAYMEQPTKMNLDKVTENFEYSYKTRKGQRLHDVRVEEAHNEFFNKCGIQYSDKKHKEAVKESINSCRELIASKTIKINHKG